MDETKIHPIYFDSEMGGDFTETGLPYRVVIDGTGLDFMLSLHIAGVFQYRVVNSGLLQMIGEADGFLKRSLLNSLPGVLADSEGGFGLPRELTAHSREIGDALMSRLSWTWTDRYGVVLEQFAVTDSRLTEQSRAQLERIPALAHADDALRDRLGLRKKQRPEPQKPNAAQRPRTETQTQTQTSAHSAQEEIQQVVTKLVSSWQAALEKSKSGAIPQSPPGTQAGASPTWQCSRCGRYNTGRFCPDCGARREWHCPRCGKLNLANYCVSCGYKRP